ncbi:MAG TPA: winged helix-turn-helix domain-containing protein [Candidatus Angelobacter sp.]
MIALTPKAFDVLLFLVQNRGRVLEKDELMKALWPESFVEEGNLSHNIFVLRKTLGDGQNGKSFIQTIPRRGYRFVASVTEIDASAPENRTPGSSQSSLIADYWNCHSPFRSLQVFEPEDAWLFFGRNFEVGELLARLARSSVLAVVGNSGCGKSSLIRAGLIPALQAGRFCHEGTEVDSWRIAVFRPSGAPFDYLAEVLATQLAPELSLKEQAEFITDCRNKFPLDKDALRNAVSALATVTAERTKAGQTRVLLVVDQFEEIFTLTSKREMRDCYINALLAASRQGGAVSVHVVLALRADFYAQCLQHTELSRCLQTNLYNVPRMSREQLRESMERRMQLAVAQAEPGLIDGLLEEVGTEPGNLALLEHALGQLWERCGGFGCTLTNQAYAEIGRLRGALGRHADQIYLSLGDDWLKSLAQRIFLELVHFGEDTSAGNGNDTRRRVSKMNLLSLGEAEDVEQLLARLASSRLISTGGSEQETFVEVSHEALIREWPRLREWIAVQRDSLRLERRLVQAAEEWESVKRDQGALLQGARLAQGEEWLTQSPEAPSPLREFLQASIEARSEMTRKEREAEQRELAQQQTQLKLEAERAHAVAALEKRRAADQASAARRLHHMAIFLLAALICAGGAAAFAWMERRQAKENERQAEANAAAAQAGRRDAETAKLFAQSKENEAQAVRRDAEAARAEVNGNLQIAKELRAEAESNRQMAIRLRQAAQQQDRSIYESLKTDRENAMHATKERDDAFQQLQTEKAHSRLLENSLNQVKQENEKLKVASEADPPAPVQVPEVATFPASEVAGDALSMQLTKEAGQDLERDSNLSVWLALYAFKAAKSIPIKNQAETMLRRAVWKAKALPVIEVMVDKRHISRAQFSYDNTKIITLAEGVPKELDIWDIESGQHLARLTADKGYVVSAVFSEDSQLIAMSTSDGTTRLWEVKTWQPQLCNIRDSDTIYLNSLGANAELLLLAGHNPSTESIGKTSWVHVWDAHCSKAKPLFLAPRFFGPVTAAGFSKDATLLALGSTTGDITLYEVTPSKATPLGDLPSGNLGEIRKIVFSRDTQKLAALDAEGNATIWKLSSDHHFSRLSGRRHRSIYDMAFTHDGRLLAVVTEEQKKKFAVLDVESGQRVDLNALDLEPHSHWISAVSPDGGLLAISDPSGRRLSIYAHDIARLVDFAEHNVHRKLTNSECLFYLQQPCQ